MKRVAIILIPIVAGLVFFFIPKEEKIQRAIVAVGLKTMGLSLAVILNALRLTKVKV